MRTALLNFSSGTAQLVDEMKS